MPKDPAKQNVVTGKVRLSFAHVWEPYSFPGDTGEPKYSTMLLIPKGDTQTIKELREAQKAALSEGSDRFWKGSTPKAWADSIHDGDEEGDLEKSPELAGHLYMSVSSKTKPGIVDRNVKPILDQSEVYSGCYARVSLFAFPYDYAGKKGVSFILKNIQKLADGEAFGGGSRAEDEFEAVDGDDDDLI
jgi:hypothetical protein